MRGDHILFDQPSSKDRADNFLDIHPALRVVGVVFKSIGEGAWFPIDWRRPRPVDYASNEELIVATHLALAAMREIIKRTLKGNASITAACEKLKQDYATYPFTLSGLALYAGASFPHSSMCTFFCDIIKQLEAYTTSWLDRPLRIGADSSAIDCLLRPESELIRTEIREDVDQSRKMADCILLKRSKVQCRPFMLDRADVPQLTSALQRGMPELLEAVDRTLMKYPIGSGHPYETAAVEIQAAYDMYPYEDLDVFRQHLQDRTRQDVAVMLCRVMEAYVHCALNDENMVIRRSPIPFPA